MKNVSAVSVTSFCKALRAQGVWSAVYLYHLDVMYCLNRKQVYRWLVLCGIFLCDVFHFRGGTVATQWLVMAVELREYSLMHKQQNSHPAASVCLSCGYESNVQVTSFLVTGAETSDFTQPIAEDLVLRCLSKRWRVEMISDSTTDI